MSDRRPYGLDRTDISSTLDRLAAEAKEMLPQTNHRPYPGPKDITSLFSTHTSALPAGQLVKDEFFTLFEAVGALEIMDPKMDSGFIPEGDSFDPKFDVETPLEGSEVLWVMDQLMCLEVEWLEGYPLSQTVFTSLHVSRLLDPGNRTGTFRSAESVNGEESAGDELTHTALRAYCVALVQSLDMTMQVIQSQTFYEEEDFVTHLFGRELMPKITSNDAQGLLQEAMACVEDVEGLSAELRSALRDRLLFRERMLSSFSGDPMHWESMLGSLDWIKESHALAKATPDAFSEKVQRQLATSTPPRPMLSVAWDVAITKWRQLISHAIESYRLTSPEAVFDPQWLQRAAWTFAYRNPPPSTLPRAILQDRLFHDQGPVAMNIGHYELFLTDLKSIVLAGDSLVDPSSFQVELPSDPRHIRARLLEGFMEKAFDEYLNLYRMLCQNRCRIRRLFTQAVGIWDTLETEGARVDEAMVNVPFPGKGKDTLQKGLMPLSTWAKLYKLRVMAWTIQMGIETDIYMNDELGSMYWFLAYLTTSQLHLIQHIERHLKERMKRKSVAMFECLASQAWLHSTRIHAEATQAMSSALYTLFFHLQDLDIVRSPKRDFSKQQLFYEARMKCDLSMSNDRIPSAADFANARKARNGQPTSEVGQEIDGLIKRAKGLLAALKGVSSEDGKYVGMEEQRKKEIKSLETTCVAVAVNATQLSRLMEKFGPNEVKEKVECVMEKRWSEWWIVPVIKERKP